MNLLPITTNPSPPQSSATSRILLVGLILATAATARGHDTWVESNTRLLRVGDAAYIDLKLGNHGNSHRDFKLAGKIDLASCTLTVRDPAGASHDLKPALVDTGFGPKEGFWNGKYVTRSAGLHTVIHTLDKIVHHGRRIRAIKSGKCFFAATAGQDEAPRAADGFREPLGHPLELVLLTHPITGAGPGKPVQVQLLYQGKPLPGVRVAFIPRRTPLKEQFDPQYERETDAQGHASFTPATGDQYLIVAHHRAELAGEGFDETAFAATITLRIPEGGEGARSLVGATAD